MLTGLMVEFGVIPVIGRRPIERLQVGEALGAGERAGNIFAHRPPRRRLVDVAFAPEVLEGSVADGALGWALGVEMAQVNPELPEQPLFIPIAHVGQEPVPRGLLRPEIARHPVRRLMPQRRQHSLARSHG